jgi:hypothetical protein
VARKRPLEWQFQTDEGQLIDQLGMVFYAYAMLAQKVTANIPSDLLKTAQRITGKGITLTLVEGLMELEKREKRFGLLALRGKLRFDLDLEKSRR